MRWSDPTHCFTEEEERAMDIAYEEQCLHDLMSYMDDAFEALVDDADAAGARLDATLSGLKHDDFTRLMASADRIETMIDDECARRAVEGYDPDLEAMISRPAATVAGSVSLLDAVRAAEAA